MTKQTFAEWMDARNLNDAGVAKLVEGLSRSQISRIRRGKSYPTRDTASKLEGLTKIPAARFLTGEALGQ